MVENNNMTFAECLHEAYFKEDGMLVDFASEPQENLRKVCLRYGFRFVGANELQMTLNHDTKRKLLERTRYENIDLDDYIQSLPGVQRLYTESGNPMRVRVAGMQRPIVRIPKEIVQKLGLSVEDDDIAPDGNEKEEIPF